MRLIRLIYRAGGRNVTEKDSGFEKLLKGSFLDKLVVIAFIFTFLVIIAGTTDLNISYNFYSISIIIFILLSLFVIPLRLCMVNNEDGIFGFEELIIFILHGISTIVFSSTFYLIFLSDNYQLNLSYWVFIISILFLIVFLVLIKSRSKGTTEEDSGESRVVKILNWVFTAISILLLLRNAVIPIVYTITSEDYLMKIEKPLEISVELDDKMNNRKSNIEVDIRDSKLIDEIVNQINEKEVKSLKGIDALNYMKRDVKLTHYEASYFQENKFNGYLYLKIYPDNNASIQKLWFGSFWIKYYTKHYKVELLPETVEKITRIIEAEKQN